MLPLAEALYVAGSLAALSRDMARPTCWRPAPLRVALLFKLETIDAAALRGMQHRGAMLGGLSKACIALREAVRRAKLAIDTPVERAAWLDAVHAAALSASYAEARLIETPTALREPGANVLAFRPRAVVTA
jgi:hypothetical protein